MTRRMKRFELLFLLLCALTTQAQVLPVPTLLGSDRKDHLEMALDQRGMTLVDLQFEKDVAQPRDVMNLPRELLHDPLLLPELADEVVATMTAPTQPDLWPFIYSVYDVEVAAYEVIRSGRAESIEYPKELHRSIRRPLQKWFKALEEVDGLLQLAFEDISQVQREYATAAVFGGLFDVEEQPDVKKALVATGVSVDVLECVTREMEALDARDYATNQLHIVGSVNYAALFTATEKLTEAVRVLKKRRASMKRWPKEILSFVSPWGTVVVGTEGNDRYMLSAILILDPGGDDLYESVGGANGLLGNGVAVILDTGGNDFYDDDAMVGVGTALWGVSLVDDESGDDIYRTRYTGQASALFGVSCWVSGSGNDQYIAGSFAQSAAYAGVALLVDQAGNDTRTLDAAGQAYSSVRGLALLADYQGNDVYIAGRVHQDYERHWQQYVSIAQGFATGMRPFAGGGLAVLLDVAGNDTYLADVYGQGVGYWYAVGMLLDLSGHDTYKIHEYGQGSGIHLSSGLLADYGGNDFYTGFSLAQGSAHDYAVGMLFDLQGDDTYTADHHSQGRGINNALGLLMDARGRDAYFARNQAESQGSGQFAAMREYGSLSLLLDLAHRDFYSSGATNGAVVLRPHAGLIYDVITNTPRPSLAPVDSLEPPDYTKLSLDELMKHAVLYGDTEERRVNKRVAVEEFKRRGSVALNYFLANSETENMWNMIYADQVVRSMPAAQVASNLMAIIEAPESVDLTRKYALFFLGYHDTPVYADRILPWLKNDLTAGATIRTLGKWHVTNALPLLEPFLQSTNERKRILAVNAWHDIQDPGSSEVLIPLLEDPIFTVRYNTQRAITNIPTACVKPVNVR